MKILFLVIFSSFICFANVEESQSKPDCLEICNKLKAIKESNLESKNMELSLDSGCVCDEDKVKQVNYFKMFGDVSQYLPFAALAYTIAIKDRVGSWQVTLASGVVFGVTYALKYLFVFLADHNSLAYKIAIRPSYPSLDGFPSGHTSFAFAGAGFLQKRYGFKLGLPAIIISSAVGLSRIDSGKHSVVQVIFGGLIGFLLSYALTNRKIDKTKPSLKPKNIRDSNATMLILLLSCFL